MRVVVKEPSKRPVVMEVEGIREINKLIGNVDEDGNGWNYGNSDVRDLVFDDVDIYMNEFARWTEDTKMKINLMQYKMRMIVCGTVVFAGFDRKARENDGACSLTDEQIEEVKKHILVYE